MEESLHYLLMADHFMFQKMLFVNVKDSGLTLGQPKVLDYLKEHDGAVQKEIASACHIEPASLTAILNGMEKKDLIIRKMTMGNRRSLYVFLTEKGWKQVGRITEEFDKIEASALQGFTENEKKSLNDYLVRIYENVSRENSHERYMRKDKKNANE